MPIKPRIKPFGIGDLKIVRQKLIRYDAGEIAHIENVMASESRNREHRRLRQVEEIVVEEIEREEESRRDLQSTERFELQQESQTTIKDETSLNAGLDVSASYGPVSVTAFAKFSTSSAKEESDRNSTEYAKEVTEKSLARLKERVRKERTARTLEEFEEKNSHGFENTSGGHISGVYRWVDKYYRNRVIDYGKRLMYEFIIPEPAAFYLFASQHNLENNVLPEEPRTPKHPDNDSLPLSPVHITRTNYLTLVRRHGAQGVKPPPPDRVVIGKPLSREFPNQEQHWAFSNEELEVPEGYQADYGNYSVVYSWRGGGPRSGYVQVGLNQLNIGDYPPGLHFDNEVSVIPIGGTGYELRAFAINIKVVCNLIPEVFQRWQLDVYQAVMSAFQKKRMEFEERLAAATIQEGVAIRGNNPAINRETEKEELKKGCLTLWSGFPLGSLAAISHNETVAIPGNYPEIIPIAAILMSPVVEMFEEAFEWKNIVYEFYPYYWGRKSKWLDAHAIETTDPVFERFLKAGAARVLVPVKPSFTSAVLYYQATGTLWNGGAAPGLSGLTDPDIDLYNSYIEEMAEVDDLPDHSNEVEISPEDDSTWVTKVPTTLVWLQGDSTLPDFEA